MSEEKNRSRDDELELERTIDEEYYVPEEDEIDVEETESIFDEEVSDEYYEDLLDEQWAEIEAAAMKAKEEEKEKAEKIKAKREAKKKKKLEEKRRKELERLGLQQTETQVPENIVVPENEPTKYEPTTEEYSENVGGIKIEPIADSPVTEYTKSTEPQVDRVISDVPKSEEYKQPDVVPVSVDTHETAYGEARVEEDYTEYQRRAEEAKRAEEARRVEESKHRDISKSGEPEKVVTPESTYIPASVMEAGKIPTVAETFTPVQEEVRNEQRKEEVTPQKDNVQSTYIEPEKVNHSEPITPPIQYKEEFKEDFKETVYESEYSRNHQKEKVYDSYQKEESSNYKDNQKPSSEQQNVGNQYRQETVRNSEERRDSHRETVFEHSGGKTSESKGTVNTEKVEESVNPGPRTEHRYNDENKENIQVEGRRQFTQNNEYKDINAAPVFKGQEQGFSQKQQESAPTKAADSKESTFRSVIAPEERAFFTSSGIPKSVFDRVEQTQNINKESVENKDTSKNANTVGAGITDTGVPFRVRGTSTLSSHINNPAYITAAHSVLSEYNKEAKTLSAEISASKTKLNEFKSLKTPSELATKEMKAIEASINVKTERLNSISADKERVTDFIKNGSRPVMRIGRSAVEGSEYSKGHMNDIKNMKKNGGNGTDESMVSDNTGGSKIYKSSADRKQIHKTRMHELADKFSGKFVHGVKGAFKRVVREDEDADKGLEMVDDIKLAEGAIGGHFAQIGMRQELHKLGLSKKIMSQKLKEIGVIVGVGDVTKMSLEELQDALGNTTLTKSVREQLTEAIELKSKLKMTHSKLADMALQEAGEFVNMKTGRLKKMLKGTLDPEKRPQIEAALKYKKLSKWQKSAKGRWKGTFRFFGFLSEKILRNNENIAQIIGLSQNAMTAYRIGGTVYRVTTSVAKDTFEVGKKLTKGTVKLTKNTVKTVSNMRKKIGVDFSKSNIAKTTGARTANLVGQNTAKTVGTKAGSKFSQNKIGQAIGTGVAKIKGAVVGAAKAVSSAVSSIVALVGSGSALGTLLLILLILIFAIGIVVGAYVLVLGNEDNGTSVPEMVQYLEDKNTDWLEQIENKAEGRPTTRDKKGDRLDEYTKIFYTYYDKNGNVCMVTDNTKELISMAAVYFDQDFSDERAIKKYLDELWEKSHNVTYTESVVYGCNGDICLNDDLTFNTTAQGFNGGTRTYLCSDNYSAIPYNDCFKIASENMFRTYVHQASYRFSTEAVAANKYQGIINLRTDRIAMGYGCKTKTETFYCSNISTISNSEVQKNLVDKTGISYTNLVSKGGCTVKHTGRYEGAPASGCGNYTQTDSYYRVNWETLPKTNDIYNFVWNSDTHIYECTVDDTTYTFTGAGSGANGQWKNVTTIPVWYSESRDCFRFAIPYYTCNEGTCHGHSITYHYCPGEHKEIVCYGHVDLTVNMEILSYDDLFGITMDNPKEGFTWDQDNIEWTKSIYSQNWQELYGVHVPTSLYESADGIVSSIMPAHPKSLPIPLYNQLDYPNSPYGVYGTVASHGCGITCVAMVTSYYTDNTVSPASLARTYGHYNTAEGSYWSLFEGTAASLGIPFEKQTSSWAEVVAALQAGKPVVSIQGPGIFTTGGHYILLTGITSDGRILVNDPNGANYRNLSLVNGFANGFAQEQIQAGSKGAYWIYGVKPEKAE